MAGCPEGVCSRFERILQRTHGYIVEAVPPRDARFARVNTGPQRGSTSNGGRIGPAMAHGNRANENVIEGALRQNFCRAEAPAVGRWPPDPAMRLDRSRRPRPPEAGRGNAGTKLAVAGEGLDVVVAAASPNGLAEGVHRQVIHHLREDQLA